jgi:hypothetical protein
MKVINPTTTLAGTARNKDRRMLPGSVCHFFDAA